MGSTQATNASLKAETRDKTQTIQKLRRASQELLKAQNQIKQQSDQNEQLKQQNADKDKQLQTKRDEASRVAVSPAPTGYGSYSPPANIIYGNGYIPGQCTWGVASRVNIPGNWGNANNWDFAAINAGYAVGYSPRVGAIAVSHTDSGAGHVALVIGIGPGSYTIWEENGTYGPFTTDERVANPGEFQSFIYV